MSTISPYFLNTASPVRGDEGADGDGGLQPLLYIQIAGRFIEHKTAGERMAVRLRARVECATVTVCLCLLTCQPFGYRRRHRQIFAALLQRDSPRFVPSGESDLSNDDKNAEGLKGAGSHFGLFPTSTGTKICGVFLTELFADDVLCARVVFPGQDGPY